MNLDAIPAGRSLPDDLNVVIEIPAYGAPIKYEFDKDAGALAVDRLVATAMYYPCNYGFVPHTLAEDGDPVDMLVMTPTPLIPGCIVRARPLGILHMSDEKGPDAKLVGVPVSKLTPLYDGLASHEDLPPGLLRQIEHFFEQYKTLEPNKWVKIDGWGGLEAARKEITDGVQRAGVR